MNKRIVALVLGASFVSAGGVALIAKYEGDGPQKNGVYRSYPDPGTGGKPWTICRGHTKGVTPGMTASKQQCDQWFKEDILVAEKAVARMIRVPISQNHYDTLVSFVFNVGETKVATSTLVILMNQGKYQEACRQFPRWKYADKRVLNGLVKRRYEEMTICLQPSETWYVPSKKTKQGQVVQLLRPSVNWGSSGYVASYMVSSR